MQENFLLDKLNTFCVPAKARYYATLEHVEDLEELLSAMRYKDLPFLVMGAGSNLLFVHDFDGIILHPLIKETRLIHEDEHDVVLFAGSGFNWDDWVTDCLEKGFYGLENLSGIPGTVGAAPVQNIGAYGVEVEDFVVAVEGVDLTTGEQLILDNEACHFGYRTSVFKQKGSGSFVVTGVIFRLRKVPEVNLSYPQLAAAAETMRNPSPVDVRRLVKEIRRQKLPDTSVFGNAGSFFKNPLVSKSVAAALQQEFPGMPFYPQPENMAKIPAGWLIEQCGWKGRREGDVGIWKTQALVIVNYGHATGEEILAFSEKICKDVDEKFGITLEREVQVV
ncbi:MAG: UDP-N-acetylmuramate dehydrogenase [Chlorobi bacterium]|nr:UDP-N-acetylmuramate dehydrogenase [Chlorobiota bacterium]